MLWKVKLLFNYEEKLVVFFISDKKTKNIFLSKYAAYRLQHCKWIGMAFKQWDDVVSYAYK